MGNYKFRLSDMMPNAWFYKLRDIGNGKPKPKPKQRNNPPTTKKKHVSSSLSSPPAPTPQFTNHRHSYYFTSDTIKSDKLYNSPINPKSTDVHFPEPPRKSSRTRRRTKRRSNSNIPKSPSSSATTRNVSSTVAAGCSCRAILDSTPNYSPDSSPELTLASLSSSCSCRVSSSTTDIIIDVDSRISSVSPPKFDKFDDFDPISSLELPPILTKPAKFNDMVSEIKNRNPERTQSRLKRGAIKLEQQVVTSYHSVKEETIKTKSSPQIRKISPNSPGLKLRANSPRIASKKIQAYNRKPVCSTRRRNLSDSFAVVKTSFNPQREFRESMVEMIVENNIRASKDLEELLACYLSLNSNEYHDIIIKVFEQIWFDLTDILL